MKAYKGFDRNLKCRGYQFYEGKVHVEPEANCVKNGFHCAENPLDCLDYYSDWKASLYYMVEAAGDIDEDGTDTKISCTEMTLLKKLSLEEFVTESLIYISNHPLRQMNRRVMKDECEVKELFGIVRGKNPVAKGSMGTLLGLIKEEKDSLEITDIALYLVDGINIMPDEWYSAEGDKVERQETWL